MNELYKKSMTNKCDNLPRPAKKNIPAINLQVTSLKYNPH